MGRGTSATADKGGVYLPPYRLLFLPARVSSPYCVHDSGPYDWTTIHQRYFVPDTAHRFAHFALRTFLLRRDTHTTPHTTTHARTARCTRTTPSYPHTLSARCLALCGCATSWFVSRWFVCDAAQRLRAYSAAPYCLPCLLPSLFINLMRSRSWLYRLYSLHTFPVAGLTPISLPTPVAPRFCTNVSTFGLFPLHMPFWLPRWTALLYYAALLFPWFIYSQQPHTLPHVHRTLHWFIAFTLH